MCKIIINVCLEFCKKPVLPKKSSRKQKFPDTAGLWWEKDQNCQKKIQRATNHQTKENVLNQTEEIENKVKFSMNAEINKRETRAIAALKQNPKYVNKFIKTDSTIRAGIWLLQDEKGNQEPSNKKTSEQLKVLSIFSTPDPTTTI